MGEEKGSSGGGLLMGVGGAGDNGDGELIDQPGVVKMGDPQR